MFFVGMACVVHRLVCGGEVAEDPARGLPCLHFSSSSSIPEPFPRWTDGTTVQLTQLMFVPVSASSVQVFTGLIHEIRIIYTWHLVQIFAVVICRVWSVIMRVTGCVSALCSDLVRSARSVHVSTCL